MIDSHAHLTGDKVQDVRALLQRAQAAGIEQIVNICTDVESLHRGLQLSQEFPWVSYTYTTTALNYDSL